MTAVSSPAWLRLYDGHPAKVEPEHATALGMFQATLRRNPDAPLMHYFDTTVSARRVDEASSALAASLADQGIRPGDRVAMYLQNVPQAMVVLLAAWKVGGVVVPCNPMLKDRELTKILVDSGSRVLICLDDLYAAVAATALSPTAVELTITTAADDFLDPGEQPALLAGLTGRSVAGTMPLTALLAQYQGRTVPTLELTADDVALMVYTSGTTGAPKGATNTHGNVVFAATVYQKWLNLDQSDRILGLAPLFHVTGLIAHLALSMLTGAPLVLFYRFDAEHACLLAEKYRATFTVSAVTAFIALLNSDVLHRYDLSALTKVYTGGAPTPVSSLEEWHARTGTRLHPMYGLTEATSPTHMTPFGRLPAVDPVTGVVSVGVPVFNTDVRVVTEEGVPAGAREVGELHIAGPQIVPGYWQKPQETAEALADGYLRTGDVGFMDEEGCFYLVDRAKDMIVASGFKVWPREVEEVLYQHPAVLEAAVVGVPDPYRGETVKAYVSLKAGAAATPDEIKAFARERMAAYKYPRVVEITAEIPKNASGKVLRRAFQDGAAGHVAGTADRYERLREAVEARTVIELGVVRTVLADRQLRAGRAIGLYERLEKMLAQVRATGEYLDRDAFLDANQLYHQYLIDLADNQPLSGAFTRLGLRELYQDALRDATATSTQVVTEHEALTDAVAAGNVRGAEHAILSWGEEAHGQVRLALRITGQDDRRLRRPGSESQSGQPPAAAEDTPRSARMDRAALAQALDARAALEVGILRLIGDQLATADRELLAARMLVRTPLLRGDDDDHVQRYVAADDAYHQAFINVLDNQVIRDLYQGLDIPRLMTTTITTALPAVRTVLDDHAELLASLRSGDTDDACTAIADQNRLVHAILLGATSAQTLVAAGATSSEDL